MTHAENFNKARSQSDEAVSALVHWVAQAEKAVSNDKLDGTARARLGELLINACRYLADRESAAKRAMEKAAYDALPSTIAAKVRSDLMIASLLSK